MMEAFRNVFRSSAEKKEARERAAAAKAEAEAKKREEEEAKNVFAKHGIETLFDKNRGEPLEYADADVFNDNRYVDYSEQKKALRKVETSVRKEQNKLIGITDDYLTDEKDSGSEKEKRFDETEKNENDRGYMRFFKSKAKKEISNKEKEENWREINVFGDSKGIESKNLDDYVEKDQKNTQIEKDTIKNALKTLDLKKSSAAKGKTTVEVKSKDTKPLTVTVDSKAATKPLTVTVDSKAATKPLTVTVDSKTATKAVSKEKKSMENELKSSKIVDSKKKEAPKVSPTQETKAKTVTTKTVTTKTPTSPTEKVVVTQRQKSNEGKPVAKAPSKEKITNIDKMKKNTENTDQVKGGATVAKSQPGIRTVRSTETTTVKSSSPAKTKVSSEMSSTVRTVTTSSRTSSSSVVKRSSTDSSSKSSASDARRRSSVTMKGESKSPTKEVGARTPVHRQTSAGSQSKSSTSSHGNVSSTVSKATEKGKTATGTPSKTGAQRPSSILVNESSSTVRKVTTVKRSTSGANADSKPGPKAKK